MKLMKRSMNPPTSSIPLDQNKRLACSRVVSFPSLRLSSSHSAGCVRLISHLLRAAVPEKIKLTYTFKVPLSSTLLTSFVSCIAFAAIMELTKVGKAFPPLSKRPVLQKIIALAADLFLLLILILRSFSNSCALLVSRVFSSKKMSRGL